ncbi:hypothetical protein K470DRAFT_295842 [Piedraia hortae CBS 480.64]|uniref:SNF2 N-terminal domain-containing protein n=1 Tax=Piedraia hortae CBS 480.64 TaxID=1314780 RepID=A0A6A7BVW7_9PEZI|nr:hypothetical protein K470DRAFT_295842 [Piedraia hortae CBS 480.64]
MKHTEEQNPPSTERELKPYQKDGLDLLIQHFLRGNHMILADENELDPMSVTATFFKWILSDTSVVGNCLLVVPRRMVSSWYSVLTRKIPGLTCNMYSGNLESRREVLAHHLSTENALPSTLCDIMLTTHEYAFNDVALLAARTWRVVTIDEMHLMFEPLTSLYKAFEVLKPKFYLLISQNLEPITSESFTDLTEFILPRSVYKIGSDPEQNQALIESRFLGRTMEEVQLSAQMPTTKIPLNVPTNILRRCRTIFKSHKKWDVDELLIISVKLAVLSLLIEKLILLHKRPLIVSRRIDVIQVLLRGSNISYLPISSTVPQEAQFEAVSHFEQSPHMGRCCLLSASENEVKNWCLYLATNSIIFFDSIFSQRCHSLVFEPGIEAALDKDLVVVRLFCLEPVSEVTLSDGMVKKIDLASKTIRNATEHENMFNLSNMPTKSEGAQDPRHLLATDIMINLSSEEAQAGSQAALGRALAVTTARQPILYLPSPLALSDQIPTPASGAQAKVEAGISNGTSRFSSWQEHTKDETGQDARRDQVNRKERDLGDLV